MIRVREKNTGLSDESWTYSGLLDNVYDLDTKRELIILLNEAFDLIAEKDELLNSFLLHIVQDLYTRNRIIPHIPSLYNAYYKFNENRNGLRDWRNLEFLHEYLEGEFNAREFV